jgi:hypothetical protein
MRLQLYNRLPTARIFREMSGILLPCWVMRGTMRWLPMSDLFCTVGSGSLSFPPLSDASSCLGLFGGLVIAMGNVGALRATCGMGGTELPNSVSGGSQRGWRSLCSIKPNAIRCRDGLAAGTAFLAGG